MNQTGPAVNQTTPGGGSPAVNQTGPAVNQTNGPGINAVNQTNGPGINAVNQTFPAPDNDNADPQSNLSQPTVDTPRPDLSNESSEGGE